MGSWGSAEEDVYGCLVYNSGQDREPEIIRNGTKPLFMNGKATEEGYPSDFTFSVACPPHSGTTKPVVVGGG
jgi:hypothetical protein